MEKRIALVMGDGSGPEMMAVACKIAIVAAQRDGIKIVFEETPMGWNTWERHKDTVPESSLARATELGILFFGGVGDPEFDKTLGKQFPEMAPERKALLTLRKKWGLLLNFRPMIFRKAWAHLSPLKPELIPESGIEQHWIRFLLEDSYFGTEDLLALIPEDIRKELGIKLRHEVDGTEDMVTELSYYRRETVEKYFRYAFNYAKAKGLPLICVDKSNVMPRYVFWRKICTRIGQDEFPEVELRFQLVDSANALLFNPSFLHAVIACGNEHGDILSDGAAASVASMGMMCSSAINPDTGVAMFESGGGTAPTLAGQDKANPLGRILTAAMMLQHIGALKGAKIIEAAVNSVISDGWRTADIASEADAPDKIIGTAAMGEKVLSYV